eukprot:8223943-Pyramimonas_sp.AAC.1
MSRGAETRLLVPRFLEETLSTTSNPRESSSSSAVDVRHPSLTMRGGAEDGSRMLLLYPLVFWVQVLRVGFQPWPCTSRSGGRSQMGPALLVT